MKIRFLGTGAAEGVPGVYCDCETCAEIRRRGEKEYHTRSQLLIDDNVGLEYPPDAYYHALRFGVDLGKIEHLLITHSHMDHFYAHDFILRGYKYTKADLKPLHIYGNAEVGKVFEECTRRELRNEVKPLLQMHEVQAFTPFTFGAKKEYTATPLLAQHGNAEQAFLYLIEKNGKTYLHLTDTGRLPKETLAFLQQYFAGRERKVDLVTFDCTFLFHTAGEVSRHMGLEDDRAMQTEFLRRGVADEKTKYVITHFSHNSEPFSENLARAGKEYGYLVAYDGLTLEI